MALKYPGMRQELMGYLRDLSDHEYQRKNWSRTDSLDHAVHFLFDDTPLADDPERTIGFFLHDASEVAAVSAVIAALDAMFAKHGTELQDAEYIALADWNAVIAAARKAHALLSQKP